MHCVNTCLTALQKQVLCFCSYCSFHFTLTDHLPGLKRLSIPWRLTPRHPPRNVFLTKEKRGESSWTVWLETRSIQTRTVNLGFVLFTAFHPPTELILVKHLSHVKFISAVSGCRGWTRTTLGSSLLNLSSDKLRNIAGFLKWHPLRSSGHRQKKHDFDQQRH